MFKLFLAIAILYLLLSLFLFATQRSLIFQPTKLAYSAQQLSAHRLEFWPDEKNIKGLLRDTDNADKTVIVFHGNAGQAIDRIYYSDALTEIGARVLLVEYPGYGQREGGPTESSMVADATSTIALISESYPLQPIFLLGESLGTGVVSATVANKTVKSSGILLITPFESLASVAQSHYWYTPAKWLVRDKFESEKHLQEYTKPKVVLVALKDTIVPVKHGNRLFDSIPEKKKKISLKEAGHNNWIEYVDQNWWQMVFSYLDPKA